MTRTLAICLALFVFLPQLALAKVNRAQLEDVLSDYERVPSKAALDQLGPEVPQLLRQIVAEPGRRHLARSRALALLRFYPSAETVALLEQVMAQGAKAKRGLPLLYLRQALGSYAAIKGAAGLKQLTSYLAHPVLDVRVAAAKALRLTKSSKVEPLLRQRLELERSPMVRRQLKAELGQLGRPAKERQQP